MPIPLISFYGDDFTGSTDALESLARAGLRTMLFTSVPTAQQLARYPDLQAFGVAGMTRSEPADEMERTLWPVFKSLREIGTPVVHYKVCSTFDSSPTVGSIGRVIDVGAEVFDSKFVPVVVGAPALGRYCVFGNLFARYGGEGEIFRLDRHPSISRHPVTPMDEADLRLHLGKQTNKPIGLVDVLHLDSVECARKQLERAVGDSAKVVLIDLLRDEQLAVVGRLLDESVKPLFVVGSSGVESALTAAWKTTPAIFPPVDRAEPILALCGSCSPVTAAQIKHAAGRGFAEVVIDAADALAAATRALREGRSVILHTDAKRKMNDASEKLATLARRVLETSPVTRVLVAGGDTSGKIASELNIESMEMIGELTRGSPLVRVTAPNSPADGVEMTFKGGQIGAIDFFSLVQNGCAHA